MARTISRLAGSVLAAALLATGPAAPSQADPTALGSLPSSTPSDVRPQAAQSRADRASAALAEARSLFSGRADKARSSAPTRDATLVLRDLYRLRAALSAEGRAEANRILARPTDGAGDPEHHGYTTTEATPVCGAHVCVHYVTTTPDKVSATDSNHNGKPDYVEKVRSTVEHVHQTYVGAGYRAPKPDGTLGGSAKTDVYLADLGQGFYGFCASDDPATSHDVWSYCVLDNDYRHKQFPTHTPVENLQVTTAHEYFHAVQFAYDVDEDAWFMEATATWAEDEVYDKVNDNRQYLRSGQLGQPLVPLDTFFKSVHYGNWIFFRYLSEKWRASAGGMPTIVRSMWRQADGAAGAPDKYSIQAVKTVLAGKGTSFAKEFGRFSATNRFARTFYDEGASQRYPQGPVGQTLTLPERGSTSRGDFTLNHQMSYSIRVNPKHVSGGRRLQVLVYLGAGHHDTAVVVDWISHRGKHSFKTVKVDARGRGSLTVPFANAKTQGVVATLVNSGTDYTCGQSSPYSCQGAPLDDGLAIGVKFKTVD